MRKVLSKYRIESIKKLNIKKYLIYAVGEILIVTIGIFLAIFLNNLKEINTNRKYINEVLKDVKKEAEKYIASTSYFIDYNAKRDTLMYKILKNNFTINDYSINGEKDIDIIQGHAQLIFSDIPLKNLTKRVDYLNKNEKIIHEYLIIIKKTQEIRSFIEKTSLEILNNYKRFQKENNEWFSLIETDSVAIKKEYSFRRTSYRYKNFISDFRKYEIIASSANFDFIRGYSFLILFKIIKNNKKINASVVDSLLTKLKYIRLNKIKCDTILKKSNNEYHLFNNREFHTLLYNASKDTISVKDKSIVLKIPPLHYGFYKLQIGAPIRIFIGKECKAQYISKVNGYVIYK